MFATLKAGGQGRKKMRTRFEVDEPATKNKSSTSGDKDLRIQTVAFLDLPPEMRNRIYDEALTHNRHEGVVARPALLATCKQVNQEARGIFRANSTYSIKIATKTVDNRGMQVCVEGDLECKVDDDDKDVTGLSTVANIWPPAVQQAPSITVVLDIEKGKYDEGKKAIGVVQRILYGLMSLVSNGGQGKRIKVIWPSETEDIRQRWVLYPFAKLPPGIKLEFVHPAVEEIKEYTTRLRRLPCVRFDQLAMLRLLPTSLKQKFLHLDDKDFDLVQAVVTKLAQAQNQESLSACRDYRFMSTIQAMPAFDRLSPNSESSAIQAVHRQWLHQYVAAPFGA